MKYSIGLIGLSILGLVACQQQEPAAAPLAPPPPAEPVAAAPPPAPPAPVEASKPAAPPPATAEERSKWYRDCWAQFNAKDFAKFSGCYAEGASSEQVDMPMPVLTGRANIIDRSAKMFAAAFPELTGEQQLTLVSGNDILSVTLLKGVHKGPLMGPDGEIAPTNKKIGYLILHHVQTTPDGRAVAKERHMYDGGTFMAQLGVIPMPARKPLEQGWADKPALISSGTDAEKANLAAFGSWMDAMNKHDAAALGALMADDIALRDLSTPADKVGKKEVLRSHEEMFKAFPDVKFQAAATWAAGDYVVANGRMTGTNTGDAPSMRLKKTGKPVSVEYYTVTKLAGGKVKETWVFSNGLAFATQLGIAPAPKGKNPATGAAKPAAAGSPSPAASSSTAGAGKGAATPAGAAPAAPGQAPAATAPGTPPAAKPAPVAPPAGSPPAGSPPKAPGAK